MSLGTSLSEKLVSTKKKRMPIIATNPGFQIVATMSDIENSNGWEGETGRIDAKMLRRHLSDLTQPVYYCVGSGGFVSAMTEKLFSTGVEKSRILSEQFGG